MPNLREIPFSTEFYHLFPSSGKQLTYGRIYGFVESRGRNCCDRSVLIGIDEIIKLGYLVPIQADGVIGSMSCSQRRLQQLNLI